jgi:transcriptional regulator GlxA family with amidase domain
LLGDHAVGEETVLPLDGSWARTADEIGRSVRAGDGDRAIERLQRALLARLEAGPAVPAGFLAASHLLRATGGQVGVRDLAVRGDISPRQLERLFAARVGLSPKALARTVRFERVRDRLWANPSLDLATLAYTHGYADQAHLTREFRAFTDRTPAQVAAHLRARRAPFPAPHVAFLQENETGDRHPLGGPLEP